MLICKVAFIHKEQGEFGERRRALQMGRGLV